ncbi:SufS family cysteine desulfurase [Endozoicomonas sp. SCSIO W0465]|uniref:SufS family cysteine desulfurase n=1 Tax=Endozoicomonas sp. SCSIO W0465 TaxID=2918516 RepID=UPI002075B9C4|nr:SufS family cysteine desulfurase [Endozoicomonas sp. SCSIO W0465]USE37989.1 SufS family cysteine desulfurase [Endozoicomonas sp. SCSIO W0465]
MKVTMKGQANAVSTFPDLDNIRQQFPLLSRTVHGQSLVYLDNAATTQKPVSVIESVDRYYREQNANVHRASHFLSGCTTHAFEAARETTRHFLNARFAQEIIWTRGATEAINLVANSWGRSQLTSGDEIILSRLEHHANIVPWQLLAEVTGAIIRVVELDEAGNLDRQHFQQLLSEKTRLVAIAHTSNAIGTILPVKELIALAHRVGALVLVDGSQAVAHQKVDVQALGADFYVFSGHKVYGPTGIGVLYGRRELLENMPPWQGGGEMIERVSFSGTRFNHLPFKFEAGTPNIVGAIGLGKALEFLAGIDFAALHAHECQLRTLVEEGLSRINGIRLIGQAEQKAPVVSFVSSELHNQDIGLMLDQQGIAVRTGHHCTMPLMESLNLNGTVRASFALYNTVDEANAFVVAMEKLHHSPVYDAHPEMKNNRGGVSGNAQAMINEVNGLPEIFCQQAPELVAIANRLNGLSGWQERYRQIMLLGKELPVLSGEWRSDDARLHGCESSVWLHYHYDDETMRLYFIADSDARVIRGLIAIVLAVFSGRTPDEIAREDIDQWFRELDLFNHLSPSRGNGLKAIVREIQAIAHRYR